MKTLFAIISLALISAAVAHAQLQYSQIAGQHNAVSQAIANDPNVGALENLDQNPNNGPTFEATPQITVGGITFTYINGGVSSFTLDPNQTATVIYLTENAGDENDLEEGSVGVNGQVLFDNYSTGNVNYHWEVTNVGNSATPMQLFNRNESDPSADPQSDYNHFQFYSGVDQNGTTWYLVLVDDLDSKLKDWNDGVFLVAVPEPSTYAAFGMLSLLALMGARFRNRRR